MRSNPLPCKSNLANYRQILAERIKLKYMDEAILLAVKNGYPEQWALDGGDDTISPLFWQALGRALGWENYRCVFCATKSDTNLNSSTHCDNGYWHGMKAWQNVWLYHWHRYIDWLAEGKPADEFFKELINNV